MKKTNISKGWLFSYNNGAQQQVDLPHDFIIRQPRSPGNPGGSSNGYYPSGSGNYLKYERIP